MKFGIQAQLNPPIKVRIEPEPEVKNKVENEVFLHAFFL